MKIKNALLLLLTASIWGVAFVAQSVGMDYVGPLTFNCVRCLMGGVVLLPCIWFFDRKNKRKEQVPVIPGARKTLIIGGICCGVALCLASNFQQFGIQYTTVGKAGFITACYIVIVPVLGLLLGKKCSPVVAGAVVLSLAGLYMLCMKGGSLRKVSADSSPRSIRASSFSHSPVMATSAMRIVLTTELRASPFSVGTSDFLQRSM